VYIFSYYYPKPFFFGIIDAELFLKVNFAKFWLLLRQVLIMKESQLEVEVQEPALMEFTTKRNCLKYSCFTGCGCVIVPLLLSLLLLQFILHPGEKRLKKLPENFPSFVELYQEKQIERIEYRSQKLMRPVEAIAYIPKLILSPAYVFEKDKHAKLSSTKDRVAFAWNNFLNYLIEPVMDTNDQIEITWKDLEIEPEFIFDYYKRTFLSEDLSITKEIFQQNFYELVFQGRQVSGILVVEDNPFEAGTDSVNLTINLNRHGYKNN